PRGVSRNKRSTAPWATNRELNVAGQIPGVEVLVCERPGLMHRTTGHRNPVEERTRRNVQELPEQVLVHERRGNSVPADSKLQSSIERNRVCAEMEDRRDSAVQNRVVGIAVL